MSNTFKFHRSRLDEMVEALSDDQRREIIMDGDAFDRTGVTGDTLLRQKSREFYNELNTGQGGFDAVWMTLIAASCHKVNSIRAIEAETQLDPEPAAETPSLG